jgi:hypothetical protein
MPGHVIRVLPGYAQRPAITTAPTSANPERCA